jgi:hypothetical protein
MGIRSESLLRRYINTIIVFLDIINCPVSYLKHMTFRRLDSVSVFKWNLLSWAQSLQPEMEIERSSETPTTLQDATSQNTVFFSKKKIYWWLFGHVVCFK